jgi:hypothetical protein
MPSCGRLSRPTLQSLVTPVYSLARACARQSLFHYLGENPIREFLCLTSIDTEDAEAAPFRVIVNIPLVGTYGESMAAEDLDCSQQTHPPSLSSPDP